MQHAQKIVHTDMKRKLNRRTITGGRFDFREMTAILGALQGPNSGNLKEVEVFKMRFSLSRFLQQGFNVYIYNKLGWRITLSYIQFLGKLYFFFNRTENRQIKDAVKAVISDEKNRPEINAVTRSVFRGIFSHYYEKLFNVYTTTQTSQIFFDTHVTDEGLAIIQKCRARKRGVLLITGHYGGVEFIPGYLAAHGIPVSIIVKFATHRLREVSARKIGNFPIKTIDADRTRNIVKAVCNDLKDNRVVITQCDEIDEWRPSRVDRISFLGVATFLDKTMNVLIKRAGAETVFGLMHRETNHHYRFMAERGDDVCERLRNNGSMSLGEAAVKYLERYITEYPHEWYQWKKYPAIPALNTPDPLPQQTASVPMLRPSLG